MSVQPPGGSQPPPTGPEGPQGTPPSAEDQKYAYLLKSPFAKMFESSGAAPTVKQMKAIIDQILKEQIRQIKKNDARWKKAMERLKRTILGND